MNMNYQDYFNLYNGDIQNNQKYLRKSLKEPDVVYKSRLNWSSYQNWARRVVDTIIGYLIYNEPRIENGRQDLNEKSLAIEVAIKSLVGGWCIGLVLPTGIGIYDLRYVIDNRDSDNTIILKGSDAELTMDFKQMEITSSNGMKEPFKLHQFVEIYWNTDRKSILADIAMIILEIYNLNSGLNSLLNLAQTWFLTGPNLPSGSEPEAYSYVPVVDGVKLDIVQPNIEDKARVIREEINQRVVQIGRLTGLEAELTDTIKFESGVSKAFSMIDTTALMQIISTNVSIGVNRLLASWAELLGGPVSTIQLDPLYKPKDAKNSLDSLYKYAKFVTMPAAIKLAQSEATEVMFDNRTRAERDIILQDIQKSNGVLPIDQLTGFLNG